jgi:hypothetical protein
MATNQQKHVTLYELEVAAGMRKPPAVEAE